MFTMHLSTKVLWIVAFITTVSCKSKKQSESGGDSTLNAVTNPAWPAGKMTSHSILAVAIPIIAKAGDRTDYKNCELQGCEGIDGLCYERCQVGHRFVNPLVSRCFKDGTSESYDRGRGKMYCYQGYPIDPPEMYERNCEVNGCDYNAGLCYRRCPQDWVASATEPTSCTKPCPPWYNDTGGTCYKGLHPVHSIVKLPRSDWFWDRGSGRIGCQNGEPM